MYWKKRPYWVKGGIIGFILGTILVLFFGICMFISSGGWEDVACYAYCLFPNLILFFTPSLNFDGLIDNLIYNIIILTLIGALIGFIIGKLKSKNKKILLCLNKFLNDKDNDD